MANHHTGYQLRPEGQESFTIIQYNVEDQYTYVIHIFKYLFLILFLIIYMILRPHCDSSCDGTKHHSGGRVATAVLYCKIADRGGATTFTKSDIFIKPKNNSVTFFSYMGPDGLMDPESLTEHSGCPVEEGEKWITTFWMREGVTAQDPWTMFDPSGVRMAYDYS
jgi:prolyl 4-hydroxylase